MMTSSVATHPIHAYNVAGHGRQRWLDYNMSCGLRATEDQGQNVMHVVWHDKSAPHPRVQPYRDTRGFDIASVGPKVCCLSCMTST